MEKDNQQKQHLEKQLAKQVELPGAAAVGAAHPFPSMESHGDGACHNRTVCRV
jgi:hypothetical protein